MGFRFHRRLNLGSGFGLNVGKSGASASRRASFGSIGTGGYSVRSGIPGLSYRKSFGKGGAGLIIGLVSLFVTIVISLASLLIVLGLAILLFLFKVFWVVLNIAVQLIVWICLTAVDFVKYMSENPPSSTSQKTIPEHTTSPEITPLTSAPPEIPMLSIVKIPKPRPSNPPQE